MSGSCIHLRISYTGDKLSRYEHPVILGYSTLYQADAIESALPDATAARRLLAEHRPDIISRLEARILSVTDGKDAARHLDATLLGTARLGMRHGSFGTDFHHYHNENHIMDLAERRLGRMLEACGLGVMPADDWLALVLFSACHDLRQRETKDCPGPTGGNEAASASETFRILDVCGFDQTADRSIYVAMELMIAGSTFDPRLSESSPDTANLTGGAADNIFMVGSWTGRGTLVGATGTDRIVAIRDTDMTLTNTSLAALGYGLLTLSGIETATLQGGGSANQLIAKNNGTIRVSSFEGCGCTFVIELPLAAVIPQASVRVA